MYYYGQMELGLLGLAWKLGLHPSLEAFQVVLNTYIKHKDAEKPTLPNIDPVHPSHIAPFFKTRPWPTKVQLADLL
jgi:hypothetical protein